MTRIVFSSDSVTSTTESIYIDTSIADTRSRVRYVYVEDENPPVVENPDRRKKSRWINDWPVPVEVRIRPVSDAIPKVSKRGVNGRKLCRRRKQRWDLKRHR